MGLEGNCFRLSANRLTSDGSVAKFKIKIIFPNNSIIYAGIPKSTLISMQTEKPKRVPSFR
ncbi:hypothetical protein, partial [Enterococcus faecalis]|uniref:hypothetical protein n=1 Tax=Enterococcus faecalis TaxID=1351 RepID=UPI003DA7116D